MTPRRQGPWERRAQADAAARGLTREEYGVYKGDYGAGMKPVTSAGGLLFLAILLTLCAGTVVVATLAAIIAPGSTPESRFHPVMLGYDALTILLASVGWGYFVKEFKASRLRKARGKTLDLLPDGVETQPAPPSTMSVPSSVVAVRRAAPYLRTTRRIVGGVLVVVGTVIELAVIVRAVWLLVSWDSLDLLWTGLWLAALAGGLMFWGLRLRTPSKRDGQVRAR